MTLAIILSSLFSIAALGVFIIAIRQSYRIERMKQPDLPNPRLTYTNLFASAFGVAPTEEAHLARGRLRRQLGLSVILLAAGAALGLALRGIQLNPPDPLAGIHASDFLPEGAYLHDPGTTLVYTRSNQDGSLPEKIVVHVVTDREVHVAKMVDRCTSAAYVTAFFDPRNGDPVRYVGGRLGRDGQQEPQAWLDIDTKTREITVRVGDPKGDPIETHGAPPAPLRLYDFDLSEFALYGPRLGQPWTFGVAMAWPDDDGVLKILGAAEGQPLQSTMRLSRPVTIYAVTGEAFGGPDGDGGGLVTIDNEYGSIIEARLGRPNHQGYDDFLLKLTHTAYGTEGDYVWQDEIAAHWADCPPDGAQPEDPQ
jgi:hypothetical protein